MATKLVKTMIKTCNSTECSNESFENVILRILAGNKQPQIKHF